MRDGSLEELSTLLKKGLSSKQVLIDVREPEECFSIRIVNGINIPLKKINKHIDAIGSYQEIYLYCSSGKRSKTACDELEKHGVRGLVNITGSFIDWEKNGIPVIKAKLALEQQALILLGGTLMLSSALSYSIWIQFIWIPFILGGILLCEGFLKFNLIEKFILFAYSAYWNKLKKNQI